MDEDEMDEQIKQSVTELGELFAKENTEFSDEELRDAIMRGDLTPDALGETFITSVLESAEEHHLDQRQHGSREGGHERTIVSEPKFMRFIVRPGCKGGVVGINHDLFEEGMVYEIVEIFDGEYAVRRLGQSPLALPLKEALPLYGFNNGMDYNRLYEEVGGRLVQTAIEDLDRQARNKT